MVSLGNLGSGLAHLIKVPIKLAANPVVATFGGVVSRLGQSIINDGETRSYVNQAQQYVSPWIAYANEMRNGFGDEAIASMSAWISTGGEAVYQGASTLIGQSTQLYHQGIDVAAETVGTSAETLAPAVRLLAPVLLALPALGTIAYRTLGGDGTKNIGERFREEITSGYARRAGVAAVLTATVAFASDYAPSVATGSLLNLGAFAGAMALADSANRMAGRTYMAIGSTVAASVSAATAAVFATQYVAGGDLDTIAAGFGLAGGILVNTLGVGTIQKLVKGGERALEKIAKGAWTVGTSSVNGVRQLVRKRQINTATNGIGIEAARIAREVNASISQLQGENLQEKVDHFKNALTKVATALDNIKTKQAKHSITDEEITQQNQNIATELAKIAPALQRMTGSIDTEMNKLVTAATRDGAQRAAVDPAAVKADQLVTSANELYSAAWSAAEKMPEGDNKNTFTDAIRELCTNEAENKSVSVFQERLNRIQAAAQGFVSADEQQRTSLTNAENTLQGLNIDQLELTKDNLEYAFVAWAAAKEAATWLDTNTDQAFDGLMATANEHIDTIVGRYAAQVTALQGELPATPAVDADAAKWGKYKQDVASISQQASAIIECLTGDKLPAEENRTEAMNTAHTNAVTARQVIEQATQTAEACHTAALATEQTAVMDQALEELQEEGLSLEEFGNRINILERAIDNAENVEDKLKWTTELATAKAHFAQDTARNVYNEKVQAAQRIELVSCEGLESKSFADLQALLLAAQTAEAEVNTLIDEAKEQIPAAAFPQENDAEGKANAIATKAQTAVQAIQAQITTLQQQADGAVAAAHKALDEAIKAVDLEGEQEALEQAVNAINLAKEALSGALENAAKVNVGANNRDELLLTADTKITEIQDKVRELEEKAKAQLAQETARNVYNEKVEAAQRIKLVSCEGLESKSFAELEELLVNAQGAQSEVNTLIGEAKEQLLAAAFPQENDAEAKADAVAQQANEVVQAIETRIDVLKQADEAVTAAHKALDEAINAEIDDSKVALEQAVDVINQAKGALSQALLAAIKVKAKGMNCDELLNSADTKIEEINAKVGELKEAPHDDNGKPSGQNEETTSPSHTVDTTGME